MSEPVTGAGKTAGRERTRAPSAWRRRYPACRRATLRRGAAAARMHGIAAPGRATRGLARRRRSALAAGAISEAATAAIEAYPAREIRVPEPSEEDCRRYFAAHTQRFARGERVRLRHVLFAVTAGVEVDALRKRAEACLIDLRCEVPVRTTASAKSRASPRTARAVPKAARSAGSRAKNAYPSSRAKSSRNVKSAYCRVWSARASASTWSRSSRASPADTRFRQYPTAVAGPCGSRPCHGARTVAPATGGEIPVAGVDSTPRPRRSCSRSAARCPCAVLDLAQAPPIPKT